MHRGKTPAASVGEQVVYLQGAATWYVDGTFKAADENLFKQAFGIQEEHAFVHAFLKYGDNIKQVPTASLSADDPQNYKKTKSERLRPNFTQVTITANVFNHIPIFIN